MECKIPRMFVIEMCVNILSTILIDMQDKLLYMVEPVSGRSTAYHLSDHMFKELQTYMSTGMFTHKEESSDEKDISPHMYYPSDEFYQKICHAENTVELDCAISFLNYLEDVILNASSVVFNTQRPEEARKKLDDLLASSETALQNENNRKDDYNE